MNLVILDHLQSNLVSPKVVVSRHGKLFQANLELSLII